MLFGKGFAVSIHGDSFPPARRKEGEIQFPKLAAESLWVFSHKLIPRTQLKLLSDIQSPQHEVYGFQHLLRI